MEVTKRYTLPAYLKALCEAIKHDRKDEIDALLTVDCSGLMPDGVDGQLLFAKLLAQFSQVLVRGGRLNRDIGPRKVYRLISQAGRAEGFVSVTTSNSPR